MTNIKKQAGSYTGDDFDDRNLRPLTIALVTIVLVWLMVYLLGSATNRLDAQTDDRQENTASALSLTSP
jgi:hypothetical protein